MGEHASGRARRRRLGPALAIGAVLALGAGCGGTDGESTGTGDGVDGLEGGPLEGEAICELLTEDEVAEAIGEHDGGQHDYALGGCVWTGTEVKDGFQERISATVLTEDVYQQLANTGQDHLPIDGFGDAATFSRNRGELWFRYGDQWCGIAAGTFHADDREQVAVELAHLFEGRL